MTDNGDLATSTPPANQLRLTPARMTVSAVVVLVLFEAGRTIALQLLGPFLANRLTGGSGTLWQGPYAPGLLAVHLLALAVGAALACVVAVPVVNRLLR